MELHSAHALSHVLPYALEFWKAVGLKLQFPSNYLKNVIDILKQIPASRRMSHREHALGRDEGRREGGDGEGKEGIGRRRWTR